MTKESHEQKNSGAGGRKDPPPGLERDDAHMQLDELNLPLFLDELILSVGAKAKERGIRLESTVPVGMPAQVYSDGAKLRKFLKALLLEVIRLSREPVVRVELSLTSMGAENNYLCICLRDHDIPQFRPDDPCWAALFRSGTKPPFEHPGFSESLLAESRRIVQVLGGRMGIHYFHEAHTEVLAAIPIITGQPDALAEGERMPYEARTQIHLLIAEDDAISQIYLAGFLRSQGWKVDTAPNGIKALELYSQRKYDLIVMDGQMPKLDGFEATKKIREIESREGKHTPILAISGYAIPGDRQRFIEVGMDDYLPKPIDEEKLVQAVRRLVNKFSNPG